MSKRVIILSDPHCGATTGLHVRHCKYDNPFNKPRRIELQKVFWKTINKLKPFAHAIWVGDMTHGPDKGRQNDEIMINEPENQAKEAVKLIKGVGAPEGLIVMGSKWHVGDTANPLEKGIADKVGYEFHRVAERHTVNNLNFHVKHKVGGSNSHRTLGNALLNEWESIVLNHTRHGVPDELPDVILRGHRHVYHQRGDEVWQGFILPCLQTWGGNIGADMVATYFPTVGLTYMDIEKDGSYNWRVIIWGLASHQEQ